MRSISIKLISKIMILFFRRTALKFYSALENPLEAQQRLLTLLITDLSKTKYGKTYGINSEDSYEEYQRKVPIVDYETLEPFIEKIRKGEKNVLTQNKILFFELTSGSQGNKKYIPYTQLLKTSFYRMFSIWIYHLLVEKVYRPKTGCLFMSISPVPLELEKEQDKRINSLNNPFIPIGLEDDSAYLPALLQWILNPFILFPRQLSKNLSYRPRHKSIREMLALLLLTSEQLEAISIWSPSYLLTILSYIESNKDTLIKNAKEDPRDREISEERITILLQEKIKWQKLWPNLSFISCWDCGASESYASKLNTLFPGVKVQGKGLLATECAMTIPWYLSHEKESYYLPLIQDVFFEFEDEEGKIFQIDNIAEGKIYQLIISQKSGLYRYRIGDLVKVQAKTGKTPGLLFIGRANSTCDLVGEKLTECYVKSSFKQHGIHLTKGGLLLPVLGSGYVLLIDEEDESTLKDSDNRLEKCLLESYHYQNARHLGQLVSARTVVVTDLLSRLQDFFMGEGMNFGDIKDRLLITNYSLAAKLQNHFLNCGSRGQVAG
jgi:hypothetical protein